MNTNIATPFSIIETLFPLLLNASKYAKLIQEEIQELEEKDGAANIFAAALSDADLSIQTAIEVGMLAHFPQIPFFGEEWKSSANTKYLCGKYFIDESPYLVTLDPIDGTRLYLDGHKLYQIILTVVSRDSFEAVLVLYPAYRDYVYALKGQGAFRGSFGTPLAEAERWKVKDSVSRVYVSSEYKDFVKALSTEFNEVCCGADYTKERAVHYLSSALRQELSGSLIHQAQVIDGAALSFVAQEMGYLVSSLDGGPIAKPGEYSELVLPGTIVGASAEVVNALRSVAKKLLYSEAESIP